VRSLLVQNTAQQVMTRRRELTRVEARLREELAGALWRVRARVAGAAAGATGLEEGIASVRARVSGSAEALGGLGAPPVEQRPRKKRTTKHRRERCVGSLAFFFFFFFLLHGLFPKKKKKKGKEPIKYQFFHTTQGYLFNPCKSPFFLQILPSLPFFTLKTHFFADFTLHFLILTHF
jgi:hypothetical protein